MRNSHIPHSTVVNKTVDYFLKNAKFIFRNCIALKNATSFLGGYGRNQSQRMGIFVIHHNMRQFRRHCIGVRIIRQIGNHTIRNFGISVCGKSQTSPDDICVSACDECNAHGRRHVLCSHSDFFVQVFICSFVKCIGSLFLLLNGVGTWIFDRRRTGVFCRIIGFLQFNSLIIILVDSISLREQNTSGITAGRGAGNKFMLSVRQRKF